MSWLSCSSPGKTADIAPWQSSGPLRTHTAVLELQVSVALTTLSTFQDQGLGL